MVSSIGPFWDANETWLVLGVGHPAGRLPAGARHRARRALPAGGGDAGRPDVPRRGLRAAHEGAGLAPRSCGTGSSGPAPSSPPSRRASCSGATSPASSRASATWPLRAARRREPVRRLRAAGRDLARGEDRGRAAGEGARAGRAGGSLWVALGVGLVSLATPLVSETVRAKWFDFPRTLALMALPAACLWAGFIVWRSTGRIARRQGAPDWQPFAAAVSIFAHRLPGPRLQPVSLRGDRQADHLGGGGAPVVAQGGARRRARSCCPSSSPTPPSRYRVFRGKAKGGLYD